MIQQRQTLHRPALDLRADAAGTSARDAAILERIIKGEPTMSPTGLIAPVAPFIGAPCAPTGTESTSSPPAAPPCIPAARNVLFITSRFPPVASVGALRVRKFAKYLGEFGWRPIVVTGAMRLGVRGFYDAGRATDYAALRDIPHTVAVHRQSRVLDNWPAHVARRLSSILAHLGSYGPSERRWRQMLDWRLKRLHDRLAFPDRGVWRIASAVKAALSLHRRNSFDAIYSSGMPFSDHLIGLVIQAAIRRPWIAEFRDPWAEYVHWDQWNGDWGRRLTYLAESTVVHRAACVVSVNEHMTTRFRSRYGDLPASRFVTIANGFDLADFPADATPVAGAVFRLLYAGSLYKSRSPATVLDAFGRFLSAVPGARGRAIFEFAGRAGAHAEALSKAGADGSVRYLGFLPHEETLRRMAAADVNVVLLPDTPGSDGDSTAKIYECLGSRRPILAAVPPNGAAAAELQGFDGVRLCHPADVNGIAEAIADLYRRWLAGSPAPNRPEVSLRHLTRRHQAGQLAACLDSVARPIRRRQEAP